MWKKATLQGLALLPAGRTGREGSLRSPTCLPKARNLAPNGLKVRNQQVLLVYDPKHAGIERAAAIQVLDEHPSLAVVSSIKVNRAVVRLPPAVIEM